MYVKLRGKSSTTTQQIHINAAIDCHFLSGLLAWLSSRERSDITSTAFGLCWRQASASLPWHRVQFAQNQTEKKEFTITMPSNKPAYYMIGSQV